MLLMLLLLPLPLPASASCAVILSFFSQTAQRVEATRLDARKSMLWKLAEHAARHLEGLKFDQSSKAKAKKSRWRRAQAEAEAEAAERQKKKYEWANIHANWLAQITTYAKGPRGQEEEEKQEQAVLSKCRIRAPAMFANLDTLWQIWLKSLSQLSDRKCREQFPVLISHSQSGTIKILSERVLNYPS